MAEDEQNKNGRLATAVLAGSALAFSSFAFGAPAALAQEEPNDENQTATASPDSAESETSPAEEPADEKESSDDSDESPDEDDESDRSSEDGDSSPDEKTADEETSDEETSDDAPEITTFDASDVTLEVDPESIAVEDFARAPAEDGGVTVTAAGLDSGEEVEFILANAYGPMDHLAGTATADENGVAEYVVHDTGDSPYIGNYTALVYLDDEELASGSFEVTSEEPQVSLSDDPVEQGGSALLSGSNFSPQTDVTIEWEPADEPLKTEASSSGHFDYELVVPDDAELGAHEIVVTDDTTGESTTLELTVIEASDGEPVLDISPEQIELDDFIRDSEDETDESGVVHTVDGLEPGSQIEATAVGPEGVQTIERDETANDAGIAEFVVYGYDNIDPTAYVGEYDVEVSIVESDAEALQGNFEVVATEDDDDDNGDDGEGTPDINPEVSLDVNEVYPGDTLNVSGSGFTPEGDVTLSWNPTVEDTADANGELTAELEIPEDTDPGEKTLTVVDESSGEEDTALFTVNDPADQETDPAMTIDPEEIAVEEFVGDPEDGAGVDHTVEGLEAGTDISYVVTGPEGINDFESTGVVDEEGVAEFVIYAPEISDPSPYLGDYTTVVTYETADGDTEQLSGDFSVVSGSGGAGGADDGAEPVADTQPVDLNGDDNLARTGASNVQLGLLAGLLLAIGGGFVVFANRGRLFGRKH